MAPRSYFELAGLAQHYGVPTRLLDWTHDPLVAAYFASEGDNNAEHLSVWILNMRALENEPIHAEGAPIEFITPFYGGNPNLAAQRGIFTHWRIVNESGRNFAVAALQGKIDIVDRRLLDSMLGEHFPDDSIQREPLLRKFTLPKAESDKVRELLRHAGYGTSRLFHGYKGVRDEMMGK